MSKALKVGTKAPVFALPDQNGNIVDLGPMIGKKALVVYFYPRTSPPDAPWRPTSSGRCTRSS